MFLSSYCLSLAVIIQFYSWSSSAERTPKTAKEIKEALKKFELIPDLLKEAPSAAVDVKYTNSSVDFGNDLSARSVLYLPQIRWPTEKGKLYSLIMMSPDYPQRDQENKGQMLYWLVCNIKEGIVRKGLAISTYEGPGLSFGKRPRRFVYLVYKQKNESYPLVFNHDEHIQEGLDRSLFNLKNFTTKYNLTKLVAVNFFCVSTIDRTKEDLHKDFNEVPRKYASSRRGPGFNNNRPSSYGSETRRSDSYRTNSQRSDSYRPDNRRFDNRRSDSYRPDNRRPDFNRPDNRRFDNRRSDSYRPDSYRSDSYRSDSRRFNSHRPDSYRSDSYKPDSRRSDSYRSDSRKSDSYRDDSRRSDSFKPNSFRPNSYRPDSNRPNSYRPDSNRPNSYNRDSRRSNFHKPSSDESNSNEPEFFSSYPRHLDPKNADSRRYNSRKSDDYKSDSRRSDSSKPSQYKPASSAGPGPGSARNKASADKSESFTSKPRQVSNTKISRKKTTDSPGYITVPVDSFV